MTVEPPGYRVEISFELRDRLTGGNHAFDHKYIERVGFVFLSCQPCMKTILGDLARKFVCRHLGLKLVGEFHLSLSGKVATAFRDIAQDFRILIEEAHV